MTDQDELLNESMRNASLQETELQKTIQNVMEAVTKRDQCTGNTAFKRKARQIEPVTTLINLKNDIADLINDGIVTQVMSLGDSDPKTNEILNYFKTELRNIVRHVTAATENGATTWLKILEECYRQAISSSGTMHAKCPGMTFADEPEGGVKIDESWTSFWINALAQVSGGPILFWPLADSTLTEKLPDPPRYLFRAYDKYSSGTTDDLVVESVASKYRNPGSEINILSMEKHEISKHLDEHLRKKLCAGEGADNLMSWTSSFPFAIQYAIYRCHISGFSPEDSKICVVDTSAFPRGQFARDRWLIDQADKCQSMEELAEMRRGIDYDNGEYLSQGNLRHIGRSCTVSLAQLIENGLYDIYPDFNFKKSDGKIEWTNRVKELRAAWADLQQTTSQEIAQAVRIANGCFGAFPPSDMALILLAFKNRRVGEKKPQRQLNSSPLNRILGLTCYRSVPHRQLQSRAM